MIDNKRFYSITLRIKKFVRNKTFYHQFIAKYDVFLDKV